MSRSSYLLGEGELGQVDAVPDELIPDHDLQLQLGVDHQLPPVAQRQVSLRPQVVSVVPDPLAVGLCPRLGSPQPGLVLVHYATGVESGCGGHRFQGEVEPAGRVLGFVFQPSHRVVDPLPVVRDEDADGIQVGVSDLLADLQVVIAVIHERLDILGELEGFEPLVDDDRSVACHFACCQIDYNYNNKVSRRLLSHRGCGAHSELAKHQQNLDLMAAKVRLVGSNHFYFCPKVWLPSSTV